MKQPTLIKPGLRKVNREISWPNVIRIKGTKRLSAVFDKKSPIRSTGDMLPWKTNKNCVRLMKSHFNRCVYNNWRELEATVVLDNSPLVQSFVKNDHIEFVIFYTFGGVVHKYYPDFIIRLKNGEFLILEIMQKGDPQGEERRHALGLWVRAINEHGGFGVWHSDVAFHPCDVEAKVRQALYSNDDDDDPFMSVSFDEYEGHGGRDE